MVVNPSQTFLPLEDSVEAIIHGLEEGGESIIDSIRSIGHIAKNIVIDVVAESCNDTVGVIGPASRDTLKILNNIIGKCTNLGIVLGAEAQLLFLSKREGIPIKLVVAIRFIEGFANKIEWDGNGLLSQVLNFFEVGQVIIQLSNILDKVFGFEIKIFQFLDGGGEVDLGDIRNEASDYRSLNTVGDIVNTVFEFF
ncbi:hypothetical protein HG531_011108 [Fusarium graminearum]|nr:hypothetical protein HG531_011108 [Fusarium graminearum]